MRKAPYSVREAGFARRKRPALGGEVEREDADFGYKWIHDFLLDFFRVYVTLMLRLRGEDPEQRNDKVHAQVGLEVRVRLAASNR